MNIAVQVENLSKIYRLGQIGTGTISHDLERWFKTKILGQEDPFLKIGENNDRSTKGNSQIVYSLNNLNFEIKQGDAVGIIGKNGAGKSTLLKILSRVTSPTVGNVKLNGRVSSLLEVGTGFHPELTGRENIFLNGAILGMRRNEIKNKFDEIVDFSGVERYIDTPVKRYSSGMYVRLAFSIAAHLESEILIVDEVLAVGDSEFQKKCLGKMNDVSSKGGRTVLFVSHNIAAVKQLCNSGIYLKNGSLYKSGSVQEVVSDYLLNPLTITSATDLLNDYQSRRGSGEVRFRSVVINGGEYSQDPQEIITIRMVIDIIKPIKELYFSLHVKGADSSETITSSGMIDVCNDNYHVGDEIHYNFSIPANTFRTGLFPLYLWLGDKREFGDPHPYDLLDSVYFFNLVSDKNFEQLGYNTIQPNGYFNLLRTNSEISIHRKC
jgi:lipopolysaccharide transport system ATP-binding protein